MNYLRRFFGHLKTTLNHKRWVFYYMMRLGFPWRGLMHDISKFSPEEFFEGVKYWTGTRSPILVAKEEQGISYAWLHHRGRNKHHYEYWIDKLDNGGIPHKIPFKYVVEMVCDWFAACRTYEGQNADIFEKEYKWWEGKKAAAKIHPESKMLIDSIIGYLNDFRVLSINNALGFSTMEKDEKLALKALRRKLKDFKREYGEKIY